MATNGAQEAFAPSDVLAAVMTMRGGEQDTKKQAHEYLERFQKSVSHATPPTDLSVELGLTWFLEGFVGNHNGDITVQHRTRGNPICRYYSTWEGRRVVMAVREESH